MYFQVFLYSLGIFKLPAGISFSCCGIEFRMGKSRAKTWNNFVSCDANTHKTAFLSHSEYRARRKVIISGWSTAWAGSAPFAVVIQCYDYPHALNRNNRVFFSNNETTWTESEKRPLERFRTTLIKRKSLVHTCNLRFPTISHYRNTIRYYH